MIARFWLLILLLAAPAAAKPVRLAYLFSDGNIPGTVKAYKALLAERPDLRGQFTVTFLTESVFDDAKAADLTGANVLVLDMMNQQMLERFNAKYSVDAIASVKRGGTVLAVGEGLLPKQHYIDQGALVDEKAGSLWAHSGFANQLTLMKYALVRAGVPGLRIPETEPSLDFGYYYPDGKSGRVFATWDEFEAWRGAHGKRHAGAPRIAIGFFKSTYYSGDTELLDKVISEVERQGADAVPDVWLSGRRGHRAAASRQGRTRTRRRDAGLLLQLRRSRIVKTAREGRHPRRQHGGALRPHREGMAGVLVRHVPLRGDLSDGRSRTGWHDRADRRRQQGKDQGSGDGTDGRGDAPDRCRG